MFGRKLKGLRRQRGLGLRELAEISGCSSGYLSKIENGKEKAPSESKLRALAKALNADPGMVMAMAGRIPSDALTAMQNYPQPFSVLLREFVKTYRPNGIFGSMN